MNKKESSVIYVGKKPLMSYVMATVMQLNSEVTEAVIKARGRAISRAVDVAEVVRNKFINNAEVDDIRIGTEVLTNREGRKSNVSYIEIYVTTPEGAEEGDPDASVAGDDGPVMEDGDQGPEEGRKDASEEGRKDASEEGAGTSPGSEDDDLKDMGDL